MNKNYEKLANLVKEAHESGEEFENNVLVALNKGDDNVEMLVNLDGAKAKSYDFLIETLSNVFSITLKQLLESGLPPKLATKMLYDAMAQTYKNNKED